MSLVARLVPVAWQGESDIEVSFEFFPPKTPAASDGLWASVQALETLSPRFVSVTCGAGGTTREGTRATVRRIACESGLEAAAHLTCVGASRTETDETARDYWSHGIRHIVALRGDLGALRPRDDGYASAAELVAGLKAVAPFEISVAAYPEGHPESSNRAADLDNLWRKIDAGAARAITQFFFSADSFLRFRDQAAALGLKAEIVPGILPITNVAVTRRFAAQCGATIPEHINRAIDGLDDRPATRELVAAMLAADLCAELHAGGVRQFHFFTLNRAELSYAVCHLLGLRPRALAEEHRRSA